MSKDYTIEALPAAPVLLEFQWADHTTTTTSVTHPIRVVLTEDVVVQSFTTIVTYPDRPVNDMTVVLNDDTDYGLCRVIGHQIQRQMNHFEKTVAPGENYKFTLRVKTKGSPTVFTGCFFRNADWSEMDCVNPGTKIHLTLGFGNRVPD